MSEERRPQAYGYILKLGHSTTHEDDRKCIDEFYSAHIAKLDVDWGRVYMDYWPKTYIKGSIVTRPEGVKLMRVVEPGDFVLIPRATYTFKTMMSAVRFMDAWIEEGIRPCFLDYPYNMATKEGMDAFLVAVKSRVWMGKFSRQKNKDYIERLHNDPDDIQWPVKKIKQRLGYRTRLVKGGYIKRVRSTETWAVMYRIYKWFLTGFPVDRIIRHLNEHGSTTNHGEEWTKELVLEAISLVQTEVNLKSVSQDSSPFPATPHSAPS